MKRKYKVGDYVIVHNPNEKYSNKHNVINKMAKIVYIYKGRDLPYKLEFLENVIGVSINAGHMYENKEIKPVKKKSDVLLELLRTKNINLKREITFYIN
jgi:hypothetical protein